MLRNSASRVISPSEVSSYRVERRTADQTSERVFTTLDYALLCQRLFELYRDPAYIEAAINLLTPRAVDVNGSRRFHFSPAVKDIPPDADSTSVALLLFATAERLGLAILSELVVTKNIAQFNELATPSGGIRTYFGERNNNDIDPVVNLAFAELLVAIGDTGARYQSIRRFVNNFLLTTPLESTASEYYLGSCFLAERLSRVAWLAPGFLDSTSVDRLDSYLSSHSPANTLEAAFLSISCSLRGWRERRDNLNQFLLRALRKDESRVFVPFYIQRTPRYEYGSREWTAVCCEYALKLPHLQSVSGASEGTLTNVPTNQFPTSRERE